MASKRARTNAVEVEQNILVSEGQREETVNRKESIKRLIESFLSQLELVDDNRLVELQELELSHGLTVPSQYDLKNGDVCEEYRTLKLEISIKHDISEISIEKTPIPTPVAPSNPVDNMFNEIGPKKAKF